MQTIKSEDGTRRSFFCYGRKVSPPQTSTHPRVVNGRTVHLKVKTCAAKGGLPGNASRG